jgi:hypothetical protein
MFFNLDLSFEFMPVTFYNFYEAWKDNTIDYTWNSIVSIENPPPLLIKTLNDPSFNYWS